MTEKYQEDGVSFTEEYQFKVSTHPVILPISSALIKAHKERNTENSSEEEYEQGVYENFFINLNEASKKFYELGSDALEEWVVIQDGIQMVASVLFQFNPTLDNAYDRGETYAHINSFFLGDVLLFAWREWCRASRKNRRIVCLENGTSFCRRILEI